MDINEYWEKIQALLEKLKQPLPEAERISTVNQLEDLLSAFFVY